MPQSISPSASDPPSDGLPETPRAASPAPSGPSIWARIAVAWVSGGCLPVPIFVARNPAPEPLLTPFRTPSRGGRQTPFDAPLPGVL
jgi:hypothetical protein